MSIPKNIFKYNIINNIPQMGCWAGMADAYGTEITSTAGFDWLLIDGEHAPNDMRTIMHQLQIVEKSTSAPVVRIPVGDQTLIKQVLDIGAQTLLVPMVENADQAQKLVEYIHYPPLGKRGVGASFARASAFSKIPITEYLKTAGNEICLLVQIENRAGLANLDDILTVNGIDGVFIGPSDLSADMGYIGNPSAPEVQNAVDTALTKIIESEKSAGILTLDLGLAQKYINMGTTFVATGVDVIEFAKSVRVLAQKSLALVKRADDTQKNTPISGY